MFNKCAHSSLCDSATTKNLDSIPSSVLTTSRRIALEKSYLSSKLTRLLPIRLMEDVEKTSCLLRAKKLTTMLHIWYVMFSSQLCTPMHQLDRRKKKEKYATYSQLEKSFLQVCRESPLGCARVCQRPFVESSIYPEAISKPMSIIKE